MKPRGLDLLNKHFGKNKFQISLLRQKKIVNFHFYHYKSIENVSCHSNQSSYPTGTKNIIYVEANVLSMYAKFRFHPPMVSEKIFKNIFLENLPFMRPRQPIK